MRDRTTNSQYQEFYERLDEASKKLLLKFNSKLKDEHFRQQLAKHPKQTFIAMGFNPEALKFSDQATVTYVKDIEDQPTSDEHHLYILLPPAEEKLNAGQLEQVSGGYLGAQRLIHLFQPFIQLTPNPPHQSTDGIRP